MAWPRLISLILLLGTLLVYLRVQQNDFILYDDPEYATENRVVQAGLTWAGVKWAFNSFRVSNWHPLTWLSHMLDCELFGVDARAHHLINVLWHAANSLVLFWVMLRMFGGSNGGSPWPAAIVAALFAWHPLHVESVAWIAERKDVLSTFFGLLSLWAYLRYAESRPQPQAWGFRKGQFALSLAFFALSLLAKPMLVTLPFVFLLLDYWPLKRISTGPGSSLNAGRSILFRLIFEKWPLFLITTASCIITVLAQRTEAIVDLEQRPFGIRVANAVISYAQYLWKTIWPADLAVIYPLPNQVQRTALAAAAMALMVISRAAWMNRVRRPCLIVGWLWFLGTLVPVIGLVQVGGQAMADRYTYFPLIGIFMVAVLVVRDWTSKLRLPQIACASIAVAAPLACAILTWRQLGFWKNSETLFAHAVAVTKGNDIALVNLGVALEKENRNDEALAHYLEALRINSKRVQVYNNIANLLSDMGRREEALEYYRQALRMKPHPIAHLNTAELLVEMNRFDEAVQHYTEAARLAPDDPRPWFQMGRARLKRGQTADAISDLRKALLRDPNDVKTLVFLARVMASTDNPTPDSAREAVALAERVNQLTDGAAPFALDTLAMAYAQAGRFNDAQQTAKRAINLAVEAGLTNEVPAMQQRLELYRSGQPYREPGKSVQ